MDAHELGRLLLDGPNLPLVDADGNEILGIVQATMHTARQRHRADKIGRGEDEGRYMQRVRMELGRMAPQQVVVVRVAGPFKT